MSCAALVRTSAVLQGGPRAAARGCRWRGTAVLLYIYVHVASHLGSIRVTVKTYPYMRTPIQAVTVRTTPAGPLAALADRQDRTPPHTASIFSGL